MGQEIAEANFTEQDFARFREHLDDETSRLRDLLSESSAKSSIPCAGLELEAWLVDSELRPAAINDIFLDVLNDPLVNRELAKFNIEFNTEPVSLSGSAMSQLQHQLQTAWSQASKQARLLDVDLMMIGILPTLRQSDLSVQNMSSMNRYRALNEQILMTRGRPVTLDISGEEPLKLTHNDVMLESATTSMQLHTQVPLNRAHHYYNASIMASAAVVAVSTNSPFLFEHALWQETRIPLFEQAIEVGGFAGAAHGPIKRVGFGSDYAHHSIFECFDENLAHYPVLLPVQLGEASDELAHLRLHNGTIWRWNRPLVGFSDGKPHIRIEHRTPAAGPTVTDMLATAAFYYGLSHALCEHLILGENRLPFSDARDNFYKAARYGLNAHIVDFSGQHQRLQHFILHDCLPLALQGLKSLSINSSDAEFYLSIIQERVERQQTGSDWQRQFIGKYGRDFQQLSRRYLELQQQGKVVSQWPI